MNDTACKSLQPHFLLVPLVAQGHMIPMIDITRLFSERGALITFITTPVNAARNKHTINKINEADLPVKFIELPFPCKEAGLPEGCENVDLIKSAEQIGNVILGSCMLAEPLKCYLNSQEIKPTCMVTDMCNPWTMSVANELGIPRLIFHGPSCLYILLSTILYKHKIYQSVTDQFETFVVPDFPQKMEVNRAQVPGFFNVPGWEKMKAEVQEAEETAEGVVINSFDDLEPSYIECYKKLKGSEKVWTVGPLCISDQNDDNESKASRGNKASINEQEILAWLDSQAPNSVVYVSFGSLTRHSIAQLMEVGYGIEDAKRPFIWVIKEIEKYPELENWLNEGFEARISRNNMGLIIKGWAPQILILSHYAVGGFLTHCGWNSILEAICNGVPMITWPHFSDQFINGRLVVEVLKIGVSLGVALKPVKHFVVNVEEVEVRRNHIKNAVLSLMDESNEEAIERRLRAMELMGKARKAMDKGGSSYENLNKLFAKFTR